VKNVCLKQACLNGINGSKKGSEVKMQKSLAKTRLTALFKSKQIFAGKQTVNGKYYKEVDRSSSSRYA
jgi:hypothetical protein